MIKDFRKDTHGGDGCGTGGGAVLRGNRNGKRVRYIFYMIQGAMNLIRATGNDTPVLTVKSE